MITDDCALETTFMLTSSSSAMRLVTAVSAQLWLGALASQPVSPRQAGSFQDQCKSFDPTDAGVANATVTNHDFVAAGTNLTLPGNELCGLSSQTVPVDLCRVSLHIATSNRSGVVAEIWMPLNWNGRLVTTGNGGLSGCQFFEQTPSLFWCVGSESH